MKNIKLILVTLFSFLFFSCESASTGGSSDEEESNLWVGCQTPDGICEKIGKIIKKFTFENRLWYLVESYKENYAMVNEELGYYIPVDGSYETTFTSFVYPILIKNKSFYNEIAYYKGTYFYEFKNAKNDVTNHYASYPHLDFDKKITDYIGTLYTGATISNFLSFDSSIVTFTTTASYMGFPENISDVFIEVDDSLNPPTPPIENSSLSSR